MGPFINVTKHRIHFECKKPGEEHRDVQEVNIKPCIRCGKPILKGRTCRILMREKFTPVVKREKLD